MTSLLHLQRYVYAVGGPCMLWYMGWVSASVFALIEQSMHVYLGCLYFSHRYEE